MSKSEVLMWQAELRGDLAVLDIEISIDGKCVESKTRTLTADNGFGVTIDTTVTTAVEVGR